MRIRDVAVQSTFVCAVTTVGKVVCWGENDWGQLGDGSTEPRSAAVEVRGIDDAVAVAVAGYQACAQHETGAISCWGKRRRFRSWRAPTKTSTRRPAPMAAWRTKLRPNSKSRRPMAAG